MELRILLLLSLTLTACFSVGGCYSVPKVTYGDVGESHGLNESDFIEEPTYQPRFLPFFGDGDTNNTIGQALGALQSLGNNSLQENLANAAADLALKTFKGDETVKKLIEVIRNPGNKTIQENLLDIAADLAMNKFGGDETMRKLIEVFKNPDNKTMQANLLNLAADLALKKFGYDEMLKKVVNLFQNPDNKTLQANVLDLAAEVALKAFNGDEMIKKVIEVFQNPGNKTLQENLLSLASEAAFNKFGVDPSLKRVFEVIQNPGNKTFQDNLLDIALDVALNKAGVDETFREVARTLLIPGNKTLHQNLMSLATKLTAQKGSQVFGDVLGNILGNNTVAGAKEKVSAVGQALKVGGSFFGGFLSKIGGDSVLGKIGQAISGGSQTIGEVMTNIAGNDTKASNAIGLIGNALEGGNITIQDAFKQATVIITNTGNATEETSDKMNQTDSIVGEDYTSKSVKSEDQSATQDLPLLEERSDKITNGLNSNIETAESQIQLKEENLEPSTLVDVVNEETSTSLSEEINKGVESNKIFETDSAKSPSVLSAIDEKSSASKILETPLNMVGKNNIYGSVNDGNQLKTEIELMSDQSQIPVTESIEVKLNEEVENPTKVEKVNYLEQRNQQITDYNQIKNDAPSSNNIAVTGLLEEGSKEIKPSNEDSIRLGVPQGNSNMVSNVQELGGQTYDFQNGGNREQFGVSDYESEQSTQPVMDQNGGYYGGMDIEITTVKIQMG